jgi:two-component system, OmpR family, response regulator CssR
MATVIEMSSTVFLVGIDELARIPDFLALGAIVIVAPDRSALRRWEGEQEVDADPTPSRDSAIPGLVVDLDARRARWRGEDLRLTDLEFRLITPMAAAPGRAFSFGELREIGWGCARGQGIDLFAVRSAIQRLRGRLAASGADLAIESVRSFGFRLEETPSTQRGSALSAVR